VQLDELRTANASAKDISTAEKALKYMPKDEATARKQWGDARPQRLRSHRRRCRTRRRTAGATTPSHRKRLNFIALVICLMIGTASLPHILMRYYTTPSVKEARESVTSGRCSSSSCSTSPRRRYAVLAKYEIYTDLVGTTISTCPAGSSRGARSIRWCSRSKTSTATVCCSWPNSR
jgi:cation/acetate symporter